MSTEQTFPPRWSGPKQKADEPSRVDHRRDRKAVHEAEWRACCKAVDRRDRGRCRVCGRRGAPEAVSLLDRLHRHHIVYRSQGGDHQPANVVSICALCHDLCHKHRLDIRGDAETGIEVWRLEPERGWYLSAREVRPGAWERD